MKTYTVVVHEAIGCGAGYWAEVEQLPGCLAFADNLSRLSDDLDQAVEAHIRKLKAAGKPIPQGTEDESRNSTWRIPAPV